MSNSDYWSGNAVNLMQVNSTGTTIANSLRVDGNINIGSTYNKFKLVGNDDADHYYIGHYDVTGSDGLDIRWWGGVRIGDYTGPVIEVSGGNVKVGDGVKLYKDGKVWAKDFVVATQCPQGWPDYVFDNKHQLIPLEELDKFIKDNKHLPEVPTSESISTNGQNLGEMNVILLKKVEELTLYIIEQNKQIELLKKQDEETQKSLQEIKMNNNSK